MIRRAPDKKLEKGIRLLRGGKTAKCRGTMLAKLKKKKKKNGPSRPATNE